MMVALVTLEAAQSNVIEENKEKVAHLLDYLTIKPDANMRLHCSKMTLRLHIDASFLS